VLFRSDLSAKKQTLSFKARDGDRALLADINTDGRLEPLIYRRETGQWYALQNRSRFHKLAKMAARGSPDSLRVGVKTFLTVYNSKTGELELRDPEHPTEAMLSELSPEQQLLFSDLTGDGVDELISWQTDSRCLHVQQLLATESVGSMEFTPASKFCLAGSLGPQKFDRHSQLFSLRVRRGKPNSLAAYSRRSGQIALFDDLDKTVLQNPAREMELKVQRILDPQWISSLEDF